MNKKTYIIFAQKLKANLITAEVPTRLVSNGLRMTRSEVLPSLNGRDLGR